MSTKYRDHSYTNNMSREANFRLSREPYTEEFKRDLQALLQSEAKRTRRMLVLSRFGVSLGSLGAIVLVLVSLGRSIITSGFYDYASIVFLDFGSAVMYAKELGVSLIESLPVFTILLFVSLVATLMWSVRSMKSLGMFGFGHKQRAFN